MKNDQLNGLKKGLTKAVVLVMVSVTLAGTALAVLAPPASAVPAPVAYVSDPGGICGVTANTKGFTVFPPTIYGIDWNQGAGNDWQWVHFRSRMVNAATGVTVLTSGWSPWAAAYDNRPAPYAGWDQSLSIYTAGNSWYTVKVDIEWWTTTDRLFVKTILIKSFNARVLINGAWQGSGRQNIC